MSRSLRSPFAFHGDLAVLENYFVAWPSFVCLMFILPTGTSQFLLELAQIAHRVPSLSYLKRFLSSDRFVC